MQLEPFLFSREGAILAMRGLTDSSADDINRYALRPLSVDEYTTFSLDLCHNQIDKHFSRFPDNELDAINRMVPGRPLMERHDLRGSLPRGTFYRSRIYRDGDHVSVRPDVYVLRTRDNADFILNIEGGVYRETSIGFSFQTPECSVCRKDLRTCDHVPGRTYGGEQCHYVMRGVLEVIEGSVVPAGSQGTGFVPQERALDIARRRYHRPIEIWTHRPWSNE